MNFQSRLFARPRNPRRPRWNWSSACMLCLSAYLSSGCNIGVSQSQTQANSPSQDNSVTPVSSNAKLASCPVANTRPGSDGLIEDFEDDDSQLVQSDNRNGYWWLHHDPLGSTIEPAQFASVEGGADGSLKAVHITGTTASAQGAYGSSLGANFSTDGAYDASKYAGISFKAKAAAGSATKLRFKVGDINTHQDGGVCTSCWNHFGKDITISNDWREYKVMFSELKQAAGWGTPRPPSLTPDKLYSLDWSIGTGAQFDIWLDDIQFIECP